MLNYLSYFEDYFGPLRLLRAISFRTLMAAGTATILGFSDRPLADRAIAGAQIRPALRR